MKQKSKTQKHVSDYYYKSRLTNQFRELKKIVTAPEYRLFEKYETVMVNESLTVMLVEPTSEMEDTILQEPSTESDSMIDAEPIFSWDKFNSWAGYSASTISDEKFLEHVGIIGNNIPDWVKENNAKWVKEGEMTQEEFVIVLKYLESS